MDTNSPSGRVVSIRELYARTARVEQREGVVPAQSVQIIDRIVEKGPADALPPSWRFVPFRDDSNLIVEIIATPFK